MLKKLFLYSFILLFSVNCFAQKAKPKPTAVRVADTLRQPIPHNRSLFHLYIDDQLVNIDKLDGKMDGKIENYRGPITDGIITNDILIRAKSLAAFIENQQFDIDNGVNHNTKVRYLRKVEFNLKDFYDDMYDGSVNIDDYKHMFDVLEGIIIANKENKLTEYVKTHADMGLLLNKSLIENKPELVEILMDSICYKYPSMMEPRLREIAQYNGACAIVAMMAKRSVNSVLNFATSTSVERDIVRRCNDPLVKSINEIAMKTKNPLRAICFLGDYRTGKKTIAEIDNLTNTDEHYYKALVVLRQSNEAENRYTINRDLKVEALRYIREINELHDENNLAIRFKCLDSLNTKELYYLAILCSDEIYTSSFVKGVYKRIMTNMKPISGDAYLESLNMDKFRTWIRICANYNTLDTFLATMQPQKSKSIMASFVKGLGDKKEIDLEGSVDVADCFGSINDPSLIASLQEDVRQEYEKNYLSNNKEGMSVYFILYSLFTSKQVGSDDSIFDAIMTNKLKLQPINKMPFRNLIGNDNIVHEQVFFYGDKDGESSYVSFKRFITDQKNFTIDESNKYFTVIKAINSKVPFEIYANKPLPEPEDEEAQKQLADYLTKKNIQPGIIIHRGHSYHLSSTIKALDDNNKIIIVGSCGGYHNLETILERSPDAQMVSSKQVGSMYVNDPIIKEVNLSVMAGEDVNWVNIWNKLDLQFKTPQERDLFNDYVPPHKNLGALFLKAYKTLKESNL
jgi:hypothetical protein